MVVDLTYFENISGGDTEFVKQMLELFKDSTLNEVEKIEKLFVKQDWTNIGLLAHKIKAPVQMIGREDVVDEILKLEKSAKTQTNIDEIESMINAVKISLQKINDEIDSIIKTL